MKPDLYTKIVLTAIAILLSVTILKPLVVAQTAHAAPQQHQYSFEQVANYTGDVQKTLDSISSKGCELVTAAVIPHTTDLNVEKIVLICRNR